MIKAARVSFWNFKNFKTAADSRIFHFQSFQQAEENHLSQMKLFASAYAQNIQSSYVLVNQVSAVCLC